MDFDILALGVGVIATVVALVAVWRGGGSITEHLTDIQAAVGAAREYVLAAEQLWTSGRLPKDGRAAWVLAQLKEAFPGMEESTLVASVESAVAWMKLLGKRGE